jgi:uncharacterized protein (TIGR03067 family)
MHRILPLLAVLCLGFAPAPFPRDREAAELKKLQGDWVEVYSVMEGVKAVRDTAFTVSRNRVALVTTRYAIKLDASRHPARLDLVGVDGAIKGEVVLGVYQIKDDSWTICYSSAEIARPTTFDGSRPGHYLHVFKRKKP